MKKNLLALSAVVLAIVFSSFTSLVDTTIYMDYVSGTENVVGSYSQTQTVQSHETGLGLINWFKIIDKNNGTIDQAEFDVRFEVLDVVADGSNLLSDESDISGELDVKADL